MADVTDSQQHDIDEREPLDEPQAGKLRIVPLGGVGEFGKNMMALEYGDDMIVVDCGLMFPEEDMLGVDAVIPDFFYVTDRLDKLRGIILTHGHEDHIGGLPYFLRDYDVPVYGSRLTLALMKGKLREIGLEGECELTEIHGRTKIELGEFEVEFLQVNHSIPEAMAVAITLPIGTIIHTGDYKFDPQDESESSDFFSLSRYAESGVLLLMADSTNADQKGHSPTERSVLDSLRPIIATAQGTVVLTTFSSALHRVQTVLTLAEELDRKVFLAGFSLERNFSIATKLGLLHYSEDVVRSVKEIDRYPAEKRILIATGSQGEPLSALSRMALDGFRPYKVSGKDTVIFSSRMIPGNEKAIYRMINHFYRRRTRVITEKEHHVHASGHAYQEEMLQLYRMLRPKYFMPIHGELRQLVNNRQVAMDVGIPAENIFLVESGNFLELDADGVEAFEGDFAGQVLVDGKVFDQVEEVVLRDRKHLSEDGMILAILVIDKRTLEITAGPDIVSRGFVEVDSNEDLMEECREVVREAFEECEKESKEEWQVVKTTVRKALRKFLRQETDRYPVILPVIIEI